MGTRLKNIFFWTYRFLQTPRKVLQFAVFWAPRSKICYYVLSAVLFGLSAAPQHISQHYKQKRKPQQRYQYDALIGDGRAGVEAPSCERGVHVRTCRCTPHPGLAFLPAKSSLCHLPVLTGFYRQKWQKVAKTKKLFFLLLDISGDMLRSPNHIAMCMHCN